MTTNVLAPMYESPRSLPECVTRDRLTSPYFPNTSRGMLLVVAVLCGVFICTSLNRLNYTDLWGHLSYGRWIAEQGQLPTADPFGAVTTERDFSNTAWLAQWLGYETYHFGGEEALVLGHALLTTLSCAVLIAAVHAKGATLPWAALAGGVAYLLALPITGTIRPQLFGLAAFPSVLLACALLPAKRHPLAWLPLLMGLWANLHGSFLMGFVVLGAFAFGVTVDGWWKKDATATSTLVGRAWWLLLLSLLAACLNPMGPKLFLEVAGFGRNEVLSFISEWAALSTDKKLTLTLFGTSAIVSVISLLLTPRRITTFEWMLLAIFAIGTITAIRIIAWWSFAWPWVMVTHWVAIAQAWRNKSARRESHEDHTTAMQTLIAMGLVFTSLIIAPCSQALITGKPRGLAQLTVSGTPLYVGDEIARRGLSGNLFAPLDWADYLIWTTHAGVQPLVYTHVHLVSVGLWNDYVRIAQGDQAWEQIARQHHLRYILADRDPQRKSELHRQVWAATRGEKPSARILFQDQKCILIELLPAKNS